MLEILKTNNCKKTSWITLFWHQFLTFRLNIKVGDAEIHQVQNSWKSSWMMTRSGHVTSGQELLLLFFRRKKGQDRSRWDVILTVVLVWVLRFLPTIPPLGGGMPP